MHQINLQEFSAILGPHLDVVSGRFDGAVCEMIATKAIELLAEMNGNGTFVMLAPGLAMIGAKVVPQHGGLGVELTPQGAFFPDARYQIPDHDGRQLVPSHLMPFPRMHALGMWNEFDLYAVEQKDGFLTLHARYGSEPGQVHDFNPAILGSGLHTTNLKAEPHFQEAIGRLSKVGLRVLPEVRPAHWVPRTSTLFH